MPSRNTLALSCITEAIRFGFDRFGLGLDMKLMTGLLAAVLLLAGGGARHAGGPVADGLGGPLGHPRQKHKGPPPLPPAGRTTGPAPPSPPLLSRARSH